MTAREPFHQIPYRLMEDTKLYPTLATYCAVQRFMREKRTVECYASAKTIAALAGRSVRQVRIHLEALEKAGHLLKDKNHDSSARRTYMIADPHIRESIPRRPPAPAAPTVNRSANEGPPHGKKRRRTVSAPTVNRAPHLPSAAAAPTSDGAVHLPSAAVYSQRDFPTENPPPLSPRPANAPGDTPGEQSAEGHPPVSAAPPSTPEPPPASPPAPAMPTDLTYAPDGRPVLPPIPSGVIPTPEDLAAREKLFKRFQAEVRADDRKKEEAKKAADAAKPKPREEELQQRMLRQLNGALADQARQAQAQAPSPQEAT